jgi:hypothetical protein
MENNKSCTAKGLSCLRLLIRGIISIFVVIVCFTLIGVIESFFSFSEDLNETTLLFWAGVVLFPVYWVSMACGFALFSKLEAHLFKKIDKNTSRPFGTNFITNLVDIGIGFIVIIPTVFDNGRSKSEISELLFIFWLVIYMGAVTVFPRLSPGRFIFGLFKKTK